MQKFYSKHIDTFLGVGRYRFNLVLLNGKYKSLLREIDYEPIPKLKITSLDLKLLIDGFGIASILNSYLPRNFEILFSKPLKQKLNFEVTKIAYSI